MGGREHFPLPSVRLLGQEAASEAASRRTASLPGCAVGQPRQTDPKRPAATAKKPPRNGNRLYREAVFASLVYGTWPLSKLLLKVQIQKDPLPPDFRHHNGHFCVCVSLPWPMTSGHHISS